MTSLSNSGSKLFQPGPRQLLLVSIWKLQNSEQCLLSPDACLWLWRGPDGSGMLAAHGNCGLFPGFLAPGLVHCCIINIWHVLWTMWVMAGAGAAAAAAFSCYVLLAGRPDWYSYMFINTASTLHRLQLLYIHYEIYAPVDSIISWPTS